MLGLEASDRILCPIPWSFDYGYGQLLSTLLRGVTHVLPANTSPSAVWDAIGRQRPSVLPGIPSLFTWLLRGPARPRGVDVACLRMVTNTGGTIPELVLDDLLDLFAGSQVFLNYGLTETYRTSCLDSSLVRERPTSIGRPIPGVEVEIRREDGSLADPGEVGEIVHRGGSLFCGYWGDREATDRALRPDPGDPSAPRVLFTGDLGRRDEAGFLYFVGRRDHQLKSMGVRVNPSEIEALLDASGLVQEVAVFGIPHDLIGHEIWAAVVLREDDPNAERKLSAHAHRVMSRYMKPRRFLMKAALPRTHTGKVDKRALAAEAALSPSRALLG
jgi:acyl-CoA synthetase (AMP-forming)/AMP-acid ligase II